MTSRAATILQELNSYTKYVPGKAIKDSGQKDIKGSTALANNTSVHYDSDPINGGHFIQRHGFNDSIERFQLTHENATHLLTHLKKYVKQHNHGTQTQSQRDTDVEINNTTKQ